MCSVGLASQRPEQNYDEVGASAAAHASAAAALTVTMANKMATDARTSIVARSSSSRSGIGINGILSERFERAISELVGDWTEDDMQGNFSWRRRIELCLR